MASRAKPPVPPSPSSGISVRLILVLPIAEKTEGGNSHQIVNPGIPELQLGIFRPEVKAPTDESSVDSTRVGDPGGARGRSTTLRNDCRSVGLDSTRLFTPDGMKRRLSFPARNDSRISPSVAFRTST